MKITLKRKLTLQSAVVYLKLETKIQRKDIKNYLNSGGNFQNPIIERRVKNYLEKKGIFDRQFQLTREGKQAKETGFVKEYEEGKYQIWYTQGDPVFGNRIFNFMRLEPVDKPEPKMQELGVEIDSGNNSFSSMPMHGKDGKDSVDFTVVGSLKKSLGEKKSDTIIDCTWVWNKTEKSSFTFSGELKTTDRMGKVKSESIDNSKPVDFKIDLKQHIENVITYWNDKTGRCRLRLEKIEHDDTYRYFEYTGSRPLDGYDSCLFEKLLVEPYNLDEARIWRDTILNMELEKQYIHPGDFSEHVSGLNNKDGFKAFEGSLEIPDIEEYIKKMDSGQKSKRTKAYWNLTAPRDLNVEFPQKLQLASFSFKQGDVVCFEDIVQKFGSIKADTLLYFDRYVINYYQQRAVYAFLKCFGVSDVCIITDMKPEQQNFNNYISKQGQYSLEDIGAIYQNKNDVPHDRYVVFKHNNELIVWTITNSISFIRFDMSGDIPSSAKGTVLKGVTYTKVDPNVLEPQLAKFIWER